MLPPIPGWDGAHPLIIHFPIALLLVAPVFVLLGALRGNAGRAFSAAALVLIAAGAAGTFIAVATGVAGAELVTRTPQIAATLERHEHLAETTRLLFSALTVIFSATVLLPRFLRKPLEGGARLAVHLIFLALYSAGAMYLANTAHQGGRLVHEFGVQAMIATGPAVGAIVPPGPAAAETESAGTGND